MKTFVLTQEQDMLRELARELAAAEIAPRSERVDQAPAFPAEGLEILAQAGLLACFAPEELGGAGLDGLCQSIVLEELAKECASTAWAAAHSGEVARCLLCHGTPEQQKLVIPALAAGESAVAAGSDAGPGFPLGVALQARQKGGDWVLNGEKRHVPGGAFCGWYLVLAREEDAHGWFLVEQGAQGVSFTPEAPKLGMRGCPMGTLSFRDCVLPAARRVAGPVLETLEREEALDMAAIAVGVALGALAEAVKYVNQRTQFGRTIAQFQNTRQVMAELFARAEAARALVHSAAQVKDSGGDFAAAAAMAKLAAGNAGCVITRKCVQFMGGYGYSREYPVERKMRDAKMAELFGGAPAGLRELVARQTVLA